MHKAPKPVGIWIRVSTEDQAKGDSPEHHERRARAYAEVKGWEVATLYDLSGVSGKSVMGHPEAKRMLADIKSGAVSALIFSKLARLARNTRELLDFADLFREAEADLVSLHESIDTSTPAGRLFYTMIAAMAQWEREEIADRIAASVTVRAQLGKRLGGTTPFGYRWDGNELVVNPDEAPIRALVFELFVKEKRLKRVAAELNRRGHRTSRGKQFSDSTIGRILADPISKGMRRANYTKNQGADQPWAFKPEEEWVWHEVEPIVSEELWDQANAILAERRAGRRPGRKAVHLFSGFAFCSCGGKMYVPTNSPKYICRACRNKIPITDLEGVFQEQLHRFFLSPDDIADALAESEAGLREKEEQLEVMRKDLERATSEMDRVYKLYMSDGLSVDGFRDLYQPLEDRKKQLSEQIPTLAGEIDAARINHLSTDEIVAGARDLYSRWYDLNESEKREIVETITDWVEVGQDDITIHVNYEPPRPRPGAGRSENASGDRDKKATHSHGFAAATSRKWAGNTQV